MIEPVYEQVAYFSEDLAAVKLNGKYGFIDKMGNIVIQPQFEWAFRFREGFAWVREDRSGFIDRTGKLVVDPPAGTHCWEFREGLGLGNK